MHISNEFDAFNRDSLDLIINSQKEKIFEIIDNEDENYLLNVNEYEYIEQLVTGNKMEPVILDFKGLFATEEERLIPATKFPVIYNVREGDWYKKPVITYHIPFEGDYHLLMQRTNPTTFWSPHLKVVDNCICFELILLDDPSEVERDANQTISQLKRIMEFHHKQIITFNEKLPGYIQSIFNNRKETILEKHIKIASLGVPIKRDNDLPQTFSIPAPKIIKKIKIKPEFIDGSNILEPSLDGTTYKEILKAIHEIAQQFEQHPSLYQGKSEENLRDLFIVILQTGFEGETSAETFNKEGKTDIILKYQGKNAFIAECKFWDGKKHFLDTIDQLLSYLTWRDSKAAIIVFVKNKDFSSVLSQIVQSSSLHPNFSKFIDQKDETWFNFLFHIPNDANKKIMLAVLLFHTPSD